MEVSDVSFTNKTGKVSAEVKLCLVFKEGDKDLIEDVFKNKVLTGNLSDALPVLKDSAEFEPQG